MPVLKVVTPPQSYPVSLAEAKTHLRVDYDDKDAEIEALIASATSYVERFLGRSLVDRTLELYLDAFPTNEIRLARPPIIEVISVKYDDANGDEQTVDPDTYTVDTVSEPGWVLPASSWPSTFDGVNAVRVRFRAGYFATGDSPPTVSIPRDIRAALLLYLGTLFDVKQTVIVGQTFQKVDTVQEILRQHRFDLSLA